MSPSISALSRMAIILVAAPLILGACGRTSRETVLSADPLKVVAVTQSTLDINVSEYRKYTRYDLYVDGEKLSDAGFAALLQDPDALKDTVVHSDVVVLDASSILLASHNDTGARCWMTRLSASGGEVHLQKIMKSSIDCAPDPAPPGWSALYDEGSNLLLVRHAPFHVYPIAGYWYVLLIKGDVVAVYQKDREQERLVVRLVRMSSQQTLAEQILPMDTYAEPDLVNASPQLRQQWLMDNFAVATAPAASLQLRADNRLETISPETWAGYKEIDRLSREEDARDQAAAAARERAFYEEVLKEEAPRQKPPVNATPGLPTRR